MVDALVQTCHSVKKALSRRGGLADKMKDMVIDGLYTAHVAMLCGDDHTDGKECAKAVPKQLFKMRLARQPLYRYDRLVSYFLGFYRLTRCIAAPGCTVSNFL